MVGAVADGVNGAKAIRRGLACSEAVVDNAGVAGWCDESRTCVVNGRR